MADGLITAGRSEEAVTVIRTARREAQRSGEAVHLPELLRIQAKALLAISHAHTARAERLLTRSCRIARRQAALSWELRSTLALASIQMAQGDYERAQHSIATICARFTEGFKTQDLITAAQMLDACATVNAPSAREQMAAS
jgi:predicted ATPase